MHWIRGRIHSLPERDHPHRNSYETSPVKRFLHDVSHRSVSSRGRLGAARGFSRLNVAFQGAPNGAFRLLPGSVGRPVPAP